MNDKTLTRKEIPQRIIDTIADIALDFSQPLKKEHLTKIVKCENQMIRHYLNEPECNYSECLKKLKELYPEYAVDMSFIKEHAQMIRLTESSDRTELSNWAYKVTSLLYDGMAGNKEALQKAEAMIKQSYKPSLKRTHISQNHAVLFAMFEYIPQLKELSVYNDIVLIRNKLITVVIRKILGVLNFELSADKQNDTAVSVDELKREIYLARNELLEYKALVEAEDAEYENKLEEMIQQEITSFFSALNNEKYGYIIDTVYLLNRACTDLKRKKTELPYSVQGVPALLDRLLKFFRDSEISPVSKFAPNSEHQLTLSQMDGCRFEPSPDRKKPIRPDEKVKVKVLSAGWKYKDTIISYPVLHEIDN